MIEYGIWSGNAGGLIDGQMSEDEAKEQRIRLIAEEGEDADDLKVVELCEQHPEQPQDGCEECEADEEDEGAVT